MMHSFRLWISLSLLATALPAQGAPDAADAQLVTLADSVFARWNSKDTPGCAVGVSRNGQTLLTRGYGMANLETGTPITAATIFESGSVAKQFTATAVILLAMDGKLTLDDPVRKYFPEMPEYDRPITIRHLLTHTSGLREWSNLVAAAGWPRGERAHTQQDLLDIVFRQKALNYPVGEHYSYTNSGYAIAKTLVERVSGKSFQEFSQERIFKPLGMTHTQWRDDFTKIVPGRAQAYEWQGNEWHLAMPFESVVGPGGLLTTVGDWLIWNDALAKSALRAGHTDSLTQRMRLNSGRQITYALGIIVQNYRGVREISHSGSTGGYSTYLARYPDHGNLSIAVLCNSAQGAAGAYTHQLADRLIAEFPAVATLQGEGINAASLSRHLGVYRSTRTHAPLEVTDATASRVRRQPDGALVFANGTAWRFDTKTGSDTARRLHVISADGDTVTYRYAGAKAWTPGRQELAAFEGIYRSTELGITYHVKLDGDTLTYSTRPGVTRRLRPVYADGFSRPGGIVWFARDRSRRVTAMHLSEGRMWDLVLTRER
jgi:CubicO group peptidase (beta-lactamase class C family)